MCAALTTPPAHAGRTDSDWLAPTQRVLQIDAPGELERLGTAQPAAAPASGAAAIVADMRIATYAEARALLQGGSLPGGADAGGGTATLSALLNRLSASVPLLTDRTAQRPDGAGAGLDCALFADVVRVRRLLGPSDPHKPGESAGPASAMGLDVPIRCLTTLPGPAVSTPGRQAFQSASDQFREPSGGQFRPRVEDWVTANMMWLAAIAGSALALVVFGLVARARTRAEEVLTRVKPMHQSSLHWVQDIAPHRLALMPRPRGGEDLEAEVMSWRDAGLDTVVSLLEPHEAHDLDLRMESSLCARYSISFYSHPIKDRGTPLSRRDTSEFVEQLHAALVAGKAVAIHCRAGIGRTGLIAGCLLNLIGVPPKNVFHILSRARGVAMPDTAEQVEWVEMFAKELRGSR